MNVIIPRHPSFAIVLTMVTVGIEFIPTLIVSVSIAAAEPSRVPNSATSLVYTSGSFFRNTNSAYAYEVARLAAIVTTGI